jgi:hypothetical protein
MAEVRQACPAGSPAIAIAGDHHAAARILLYILQSSTSTALLVHLWVSEVVHDLGADPCFLQSWQQGAPGMV